jgi:hypothetical protein
LNSWRTWLRRDSGASHSDNFPAYEVPDRLDLWAKYEDVAMHFNDLLMRLRTQALAGIAAVSTLVGIFTKDNLLQVQSSWLVATFIFLGMAAFWIAIGTLDLFYYNRLLNSAVAALINLEKSRPGPNHPNRIDLSTIIALEFVGTRQQKTELGMVGRPANGVIAFYSIVLLVILGGAYFSYRMHSAPSIKVTNQVVCVQHSSTPTKKPMIFDCATKEPP